MAIWKVVGLVCETHIYVVEIDAPTEGKAINKAASDWGITQIRTVTLLKGRKKINPRYKR